tara:strand:- start:321 stop:539 length:219 start_codon:yes stop_codon:yes gene_type:complete
LFHLRTRVAAVVNISGEKTQKQKKGILAKTVMTKGIIKIKKGKNNLPSSNVRMTPAALPPVLGAPTHLVPIS